MTEKITPITPNFLAAEEKTDLLPASELRVSERRYRRLFEAAHDGILILDGHTRKITDVNPFLVDLLGYSFEEFLGKELWEIGLLKDSQASTDAFEELQKVGYIRYDNLPLKTKAGRCVPVEFVSNVYTEGSHQVIQCNIRDNSGRHQAAEQLVFQKMLLEAQAEASLDGILMVSEDGKILSYNQRLLEMWKIPPHIVADGDDVPLLQAVLDQVVDPEQFAEKVRCIYEDQKRHCRDGVTLRDGRVFDRYSAPITNATGFYCGRVWYFHDVTEFKKHRAELLSANDALEERVAARTAELQQARQVADAANFAKSEFLSRMSHELRTPLNSILGFGQILDRQELTARQHESIDYILKGGRHLLALINEVLDIARVEAGHIELSIEPVALVEVVAECCALVRPLAQERAIRLVENLADHRGDHVMADRQRLKQVLLNLLSNAIKYNRDAGEVVISVAPGENQRLQLRVRDSGQGLSPQDLKKLFTPFERLEAANLNIEGTGLGLVLSQRLMTSMAGTLEVESVLGQGTTFWIELPGAESPLDALNELPAAPPLTAVVGSTNSYAVLSIEDNLSNIRLLEAILESRPEVTLLTAMQGSLGLDLARQHHPDVVLLDLNLPGMQGQEVLKLLKQSEATRMIPVIIISADATPSQTERLLAAGAIAYLTKPLDVDRFLEILDETLHKSDAAV